jgi:hypothetical protein
MSVGRCKGFVGRMRGRRQGRGAMRRITATNPLAIFLDLRKSNVNRRHRPTPVLHRELRCRTAAFAFLPFFNGAAFLPVGWRQPGQTDLMQLRRKLMCDLEPTRQGSIERVAVQRNSLCKRRKTLIWRVISKSRYYFASLTRPSADSRIPSALFNPSASILDGSSSRVRP